MCIEEFGEVVVVIDYWGGGIYVDNVEFVVDDVVWLIVVWIVDWVDDIVYFSVYYVWIGKDVVLCYVIVMLGGDVV